jgi:hypothetical protein
VKRSLAVLLGGTVALWAALAYPAWLLGGESALLFSGVAAFLCLVPALATLAWSSWALHGPPQRQLAAVFGGMGVRMLGAVGVGILLYNFVPKLGHSAFLIWVIVFYLATLTLEIAVLLGRRPAVRRSAQS